MTKYEFHASEFMTIREKELVLKSWIRFLKNGLRLQDFTNRLYQHLHLHCGFIAHYNRLGFYETYFTNGEDTIKFLSRFDERLPSGNGRLWTSGDYEDLAKAMMAVAAPYLPTLLEAAQGQQRSADLAEAERLAAKHGVEVHLTD